MSDLELLRTHAERIRASGGLGRSPLIRRLFDFLLDCSVAGRSPKEIEVAIDVFGKSAAFDVSQDAMVRVYIHKLRRKLEDFYAGPGRSESARIVIPKGAYRFSLETQVVPAAVPLPHSTRWKPVWLTAALVISIVLNGVAFFAPSYRRLQGPPDALGEVRSNPIWSRILKDDRPIYLVLGDYYIFGETDRSMEVKRLIREFSINSPGDLEQYLNVHPELADRYMDVNLNYLPTATAFALRDVMPLLASANRRVRVTMASDLNPATLTHAHIVYVGYLSGMGMLHDLVFSGSRFAPGGSYDEVLDRSTGIRYMSQAAVPFRGDDKYHDYGYFATFPGPTGNQILIIAGMRDVALMQTAAEVSGLSTIDQLTASAGAAQSFEALYDVDGMERTNIGGKLLLTSKLDISKIWTGEPVRSAATTAAVGR